MQWCRCRRHSSYSHTSASYRPGQEQRRGSALHTTGTATGSALHTTGAATGQHPSQGKSSDRAAPFTQQEQRQGSALHTAGAATGQRPSQDGSSDRAAPFTRQDSKGAAPLPQHNGKGAAAPTPQPEHRTTWGQCPFHNTTARGRRPHPSRNTGDVSPLAQQESSQHRGPVPLLSGRTRGRRNVHSTTARGQRPRSVSSWVLALGWAAALACPVPSFQPRPFECVPCHHVPLGCSPVERPPSACTLFIPDLSNVSAHLSSPGLLSVCLVTTCPLDAGLLNARLFSARLLNARLSSPGFFSVCLLTTCPLGACRPAC